MSENDNQTHPVGGASATQRRRYERPRILSRETLEAVAALCSGVTAKADPISCPLATPLGS